MSVEISYSQTVIDRQTVANKQIAFEPAKNIPGLTSLRFFAAMAVVLYHTQGQFQIPGMETLWRFSRMGGAGVSIFFILSGFILFYTYERSLKLQQLDVRNFLYSRFARIYPVYLIGLALSLPGFIASMSGDAANGGITHIFRVAATVPFLLQSWDPATACHWNCPGWSLSAEVFFYALFPFIGSFAVRLSRRRTPFILILVYGLIVAAPLYYLLAGGVTSGNDINAVPDLMVLRFNPLVRLPEFILGVLVARAVVGIRWKIPVWGVCLAAAAVITALYGSYYLPSSVGETLVENGLFAPLFAFLIVAIAKGPSSVLAGAAWVRLGAASYALYIVHIPIWGMFRYSARIGLTTDPTQNLPLYLCYIALVLGGSIFINRWVEIPCLEIIKRWGAERRFKPRLKVATSINVDRFPNQHKISESLIGPIGSLSQLSATSESRLH